MNPEILHALRQAEQAAQYAINPRWPETQAVHDAIARVLRMAEKQAATPVCEAANCTTALEYAGVGRHPRFCSNACRNRAHRAARAGR